jgi:hydroxypyruvate isomerase
VPKLAANLKFLFNEFDFLDRFAAAAKAGFRGVEYQSPYDCDTKVLKEKLAENNLEFLLLNLPSGDRAGDRGIACFPDRIAEFEAGVDTAIKYAMALGCKQANCLSGIRPPGLGPVEARATFIRNLKYAAPRFSAAGIRLLVEAISTRDIPGFFLTNTAQSLDIIDAVGSDNVFLQFDIYHMQIMQGDLAPTIERHLKSIAHMQLADTPGRHEPGTGEINYPFLFDFLDRIGYPGWIGCEYQPAGSTVAGLGWAAPYLQKSKS